MCSWASFSMKNMCIFSPFKNESSFAKVFRVLTPILYRLQINYLKNTFWGCCHHPLTQKFHDKRSFHHPAVSCRILLQTSIPCLMFLRNQASTTRYLDLR